MACFSSPNDCRFFPLHWCAGYGHRCKSLRLAFISIHSWSGLVSCTERTGFSLFYGVLAWTLSPSASFEIVLHAIGGDLPPCKGFKYLWLGTGRFPVYHNNLEVGWKANLIFTWGTEKWKGFLHYSMQNIYFKKIYIYTSPHYIHACDLWVIDGRFIFLTLWSQV